MSMNDPLMNATALIRYYESRAYEDLVRACGLPPGKPVTVTHLLNYLSKKSKMDAQGNLCIDCHANKEALAMACDLIESFCKRGK